MSMVEVGIRKQLGAFQLDVAFTSTHHAIALFGPSGSGKTSVVNAIAGLMRPDEGRITVDGAVLFDSASRVDLPIHRRRVGYVFQDGRLFPHLSVASNLRYGRWFAPHGPDEVSEDFVVDLLGIRPILARRPHALSGGEAQRVAIGRALLSRPRILLLDEPLASLDQARREDILPFLERVRDEMRTPIIFVSHDRSEVERLATEVVHLEQGRVRVITGPESDWS